MLYTLPERRRNLIKATCAIIMVAASCVQQGFAGDRCSDILAQGIRDEYNFSFSESVDEAVYKAVCMKGHKGRNRSSGFSFNIPVPELKAVLGLGSDDTYSSSKRTEFCSSASSRVDRSQAVNFAKSLINENVIRAWESCMSSKGLYCEAQNINESHFRLKVSWDPSVRAEEPRIEGDLTVIGGRCDNLVMLKTGKYIREKAPVTEACRRDPGNADGRVFAILNTTQGSVDCVVPKPVQPLDPDDYLQACIEGNYEGCTGLQAQARKKKQACIEAAGPAPARDSAVDAQHRAAMMRSCVNIEGNTKGVIALIENLWRDCNRHSAESAECRQARHNLTTSLH